MRSGSTIPTDKPPDEHNHHGIIRKPVLLWSQYYYAPQCNLKSLQYQKELAGFDKIFKS